MVSGTTNPPSGASPSSRTSEKFDGCMPPRVDTYCIALVFVNEIADLDDLIAARAHAHTGDAHTGQLFKLGDVVLCVFWQIVECTGAGDVLFPTGEVFINRFGVVEFGLRHRHDVVADPIDLVGHTHRDLLNTGQHVEFGHEVVGETVNHRSVAGHHGVIPTRAAWAAGVDTKLTAGGTQLFAHLIKEFGWERTRSNACGVRLDDPDRAGEPGTANASSNLGAACG